MTPSTGGMIAVIDERGSRYATAGVLRFWMPVPGETRESDLIIVEIDGEQAVTVEASYDGQPLLAGGGYVERFVFEIALPMDTFGRAIALSLRTERGMPIGSSSVRLDVDARGDAILSALNASQREMIERAQDFVKRGRAGMANLIFQQVYCPDLFGDNATLLTAARVAADVGDRAAATILFTRANIGLPERYALLSLAGKVLLKLDRFAEAKACFDRAIARDPVAIDARNGRIKAVIGEKDWQPALLAAHRLRRDTPTDLPTYADICGTIAWLYLNLSQPQRALVEVTAALKLHPASTRLMQMQGDALVRLSRYEEAIAVYQKALIPDNKVPLLRKRLASALMLVGQFGAAADQDSGRMHTPTFTKLNNVPEDLPLWRGDLRPGGKLLVWAEVNFGVGQNLLHASILPDLIALGLDIVLEIEARLVPVFSAAFPQIDVVEQVRPGEARGDWIKSVAFHMPIGSLVRYFRRELTDYAASQPFLRHDPEQAAALRQELLAASNGKRFLVGFSWTSNNPYVGDEKTVPLDQLLNALDLPGVGLVNLQYGGHARAIAEASAQTGVPVLEAAGIDRTNDLAGMCDLEAALDMVVCIGHTTAHLAGGLGVPNLVLVPSSPFAHWLGSGDACVWYPNSRIIRQKPEERGDWRGALAKAAEYLALTVLGIGLPDIADDPLVVARRGGTADPVAIFCRNALGLAMAEYEYRQIDEIIAEIERRYPCNPELLTLVGDCHYRIGRFESALSAYQQAMDAGGDNVELTARKVQVLLECYELDVAATLLRQLFAAQPELNQTRPDLVILDAQISACQDRHVAVIERLKPVIESDPLNQEAALTIANAYSARGEHEKAHRALAGTLDDSVSSELASNLGIVLGRSGYRDLATRVIEHESARGSDPLGTFWRAQFAKDTVKRSARLFRASETTYPVAAAQRITVFVCMDTSYCLRYLGSIAASIAENSPNANLHVHIVNPHDEARARLKATERLLGPGRVSCSFETARLANFNPEQRKTYFASIRFVRLAELMEAAPGTYFVMDVDNIVRGDLSGCIGLARGTDMLIRNRFSMRPHLAVAACGIVLSNSDAARAFMNRAAEFILDAFHSGHVAWFLDQIALTLAMKAAIEDPLLQLDVKQLPRTLLDWDFDDDSLVWTGKGKRRLRNRRYQAEYNRYLEAFNHAMLDVV